MDEYSMYVLSTFNERLKEVIEPSDANVIRAIAQTLEGKLIDLKTQFPDFFTESQDVSPTYEHLSTRQAEWIIDANLTDYNDWEKEFIFNSCLRKNGHVYVDEKKLRNVIRTGSGRKLVSLRDLLESIKEKRPQTDQDQVRNVFLSPLFENVRAVYSSILYNQGQLFFANKETSIDDMTQMYLDAQESLDEGNFSLKEVVRTLVEKHNGSPFAPIYIPLSKCIDTTENGTYRADSVKKFFSRINGYDLIPASCWEEIAYLKEDSKRKRLVNILFPKTLKDVGRDSIKFRFLRKGAKENLKEAVGILSSIKDESTKRFRWEVEDSSIVIDYNHPEYELEIRFADNYTKTDLYNFLEFINDGPIPALKKKINHVIPPQIPRKELLKDMVPALQTHYLLDERLHLISSQTGLAPRSIISRISLGREKYEDCNVKHFYKNERGAILSYPIESEHLIKKILVS